MADAATASPIAALLAARGAAPGAAAPTPGAPTAPGVPPAPAGLGAPNPLTALAQRGATPGAPDNMMQMLMFMAGMGFPEFVRSMEKLRGGKEGHKAKAPTTGLPADAARSGGMAPPPQLAAALAQRAQMARMMPQLGAGAGAMGMPISGMPPSMGSGTPF